MRNINIDIERTGDSSFEMPSRQKEANAWDLQIPIHDSCRQQMVYIEDGLTLRWSRQALFDDTSFVGCRLLLLPLQPHPLQVCHLAYQNLHCQYLPFVT